MNEIKPEDYEIAISERGDVSVVSVRGTIRQFIGRNSKPPETLDLIVADAIEQFITLFALDTPYGCSKRCGTCTWYQLDTRTLRDDGSWPCLVRDCDGTLVRNGTRWSVPDPGIHFECARCGFQTAVHESQLQQELVDAHASVR